ncbi:MAG: hypothetical protein ACC700_18600 [Anaerolineales bacterium]
MSALFVAFEDFILSRDAEQRLLSGCGTRDRALVLTLIDSGIRRGEALALDWDDR